MLCLLAAIVTLVFLFVDGYHGWLYSEASKHAYAVERLLSTYYNALSRADDDPEELIFFVETSALIGLACFTIFQSDLN